ncbi:MAG: DUF998 domain-containing protein [Methanomassiliicoccaceae archaeon]|nr:DUF998 domain-containing protein [Methanomassiliicoccaceae archaeon]
MELVKERNIFIGLAALLAVIVFGLSWYTAAHSDPAWVFGTNFLSDLGVSDIWAANMFFNMGCLFAGILFIWFGLGLLLSNGKVVERAAGLLVVISGLAMALIGIITEGESLHAPIAYAAFGVGFLALILLALKDWKDGLKVLSLLTPIGIVLGALTYLILETEMLTAGAEWCFLVGFPGVETMAALILLTLFALQGMKYLYQGALEKRLPDGTGISDRHRLGYGFALLVGATAFLVFWLFSIQSVPEWSFGGDLIYELGMTGGDATAYFSIACMVGGAFLVFYGVGAGMMRRIYARNVSGFFITMVGIVLILEGLALMASGEVSEVMEYIVIVMGVAALACITLADWQQKRMITAAFYLVILLCGATALLFFGYELASAVAVLAFFVMLLIEGTRLINSVKPSD